MEPITSLTPLLLAAVEWGRSTALAAKNTREQRAANLLEHAAILVAGLRQLDQRFTELFVPLTFYDPRSWSLERRQKHAEDILAFIFHDQVIPRLGDAITWLRSSPADDPQVNGLIESLSEIASAAIWAVPSTKDVERAAKTTDPSQRGEWEFSDPLTWADGARWLTMPDAAMNIDFSAIPAVVQLADMLRNDDPETDDVRAAAQRCLIRPESISPPYEMDARGFTEPTVLMGRRSDSHARPGIGPPTPSVSPLRPFADNAGSRFQELLAAVQVTFPDIPNPRWMYGG